MTTTVPGLNLPTQTAMLAGNPRDSAIAAQTASNNKLAALNAAVGGGGGYGLPYSPPPTGGGGGGYGLPYSPPPTGGGGCEVPPGTAVPHGGAHAQQQWPMWIKPPTSFAQSVKRRRRHNYTQKRTRTRNRKRGRRHCRCSCPCHVCRNECKYRRNKRARRTRGGAAAAAPATIQVPQFTMQYAPTGGPGQTPNDLIKQNSQISTQAAANAVYDKYASQK